LTNGSKPRLVSKYKAQTYVKKIEKINFANKKESV